MDYQYVTSNSELQKLCQLAASFKVIALDTEFVRRSTYYPQLALLQIGLGSDCYLIDPYKIEDWTALTDLFNQDIQFILHSCAEDMEVFRYAIGAIPKRLFDTQIAGAFLGWGDAISYASLVNKLFNIDVDKSETRSDWSRRPLTESQKIYAAQDVRWLTQAYVKQSELLMEQGKLAWIRTEFERQLATGRSETPVSAAWLKVKGAGNLLSDQIPLWRDLASWRETRARQEDMPKTWVLKDPELIQVIIERPMNMGSLSRLDVHPSTVRRFGKEIIAVINAAERESDEQNPLQSLTLEQRQRLKKLQSVVKKVAEDRQVAPRFLASKQVLQKLMLQAEQGLLDNPDTQPDIFTDWRATLLADALKDILGVSNVD